jgi:serine/threonine-protein kinase
MRRSHPESLSAESLGRLERLYWAAAEMPPDERRRFVDSQDPDLKRELELMLEADDSGGPFLDHPLPEVLAQDLPQSTLARWQLRERIGEGGLGVVYRAECEQDGVRLESAVKILRPGFDTGKFHERFVQERQILAGLDHPAIVRLMDCGADEDGRSFLVMEFVRGEALDQYLSRIDPPAAKRLELFETVCEAVGYLHAHLVVHGDIKPSNVLVTAEGAPKLLDFGAARLLSLDSKAAHGELTQILLTPLYASPEQKRGEGPSVAGDIYSLGRLLQEMLPQSTGDVGYLRGRCLAEDPADRYRSAAEIVEDLRRLREGQPLRARPATMAYVTRRFLRRNWAVASLTALLVCSLAGGWWRAEWASRRASAAAAEATRNRQVALEQEAIARENAARAESSTREAVANADRLEALVNDLLDDNAIDPEVVDQQQRAVESSLRRAAAALETLPGPPRWGEISVACRRVAMILAHRGEFTGAKEPMRKARAAADRWAREQPSTESRRNALLTLLYEMRLERQRGDSERGYQLAHLAMADFATLPASAKAELNGTIWIESARLAVVRDLILQKKLEQIPALLEQVVRNSHGKDLIQTCNLALTNLVWALRRLNRLEEARHWCGVARDWHVIGERTAYFCAEPLAAFTDEDHLFPTTTGALTQEDLRSLLTRINQLIEDRHEDPESFPLNIALGRAYARLAEHYFATGQPDLASPAVRQAMSIRDALVARDPKSVVVTNYQKRVDGLEKARGQER